MTPLVLVHGFMGGSAQWAPLVAGLSRAFDVIALDLPGFGRNNCLPPLTSIEAYADWVAAQLHDRGVRQCHLLGHSMGGMIVQEVAFRNAGLVDHLILYATGAVGVLPGRFETIAQSKARAQTDGTETTARRIAATWFLDRENAAAYETCADIAAQSAPEAIPAGLDAMQNWSGADTLPAIPAKTLVIWGDRDRTYPWSQIKRLWREIPQTSLAVVPGCAHAVHLEKPQIFNRLLLDFLCTSESAEEHDPMPSRVQTVP